MAAVEELETGLTYEPNKNNDITPYGMVRSSESGIGVDNYDRCVDLASGDTTLHDTVGIAYQAIINTCTSNILTSSTQDVSIGNEIEKPCSSTQEILVPTKGRKRRTLRSGHSFL